MEPLSASGHIRAKNGAECDLDIAWEEMTWQDKTKHNRTWWGVLEVWSFAGIDLVVFSSVFSPQASSSDLPLKHVDTMVSFNMHVHNMFFNTIFRSSLLFCLDYLIERADSSACMTQADRSRVWHRKGGIEAFQLAWMTAGIHLWAEILISNMLWE